MNKRERIYAFDFIRMLSVGIIIFGHFMHGIIDYHVMNENVATTNFFGIGHNLTIGQLGVTLFFILSGASLYYNYSDNINYLDFYKKRIIKIYIPFYVTYVFALWISLLINKGFHFNAHKSSFLLTLLGMDGYIGSLYPVRTYYLVGEWFLGCIIVLYILFPILRFLANRFPHVTLCALIAFQIAICIFAADWVGAGGRAATRILEFYYGMYFMKAVRERQKLPIPEMIILAVIFFIPIKIPLMLRIVVTGICAFHTLFFVGSLKVVHVLSGLCKYITKHSYVIFLSHHILIKFICQYFEGGQLGYIELINLLMIMLVVILSASTLIDLVVSKILSMIERWRKGEYSLTCK